MKTIQIEEVSQKNFDAAVQEATEYSKEHIESSNVAIAENHRKLATVIVLPTGQSTEEYRTYKIKYMFDQIACQKNNLTVTAYEPVEFKVPRKQPEDNAEKN